MASSTWLAATFLLEEGRWQAKRQSVCALKLRNRAIGAAQEGQQRLDALTALSAAATGDVNAARLGGAGGRGGLLHLAVGQGVAKADIHGGRTLALAGTRTAYRLVAYVQFR